MEKVSARKGRLVIISGASAGAGKDTIVKLFLKRHPDWTNPPSTVTRPPRAGEIEGQDYYFVSTSAFEKKKANGEFLETDFHAGHWYGTLREPIADILRRGKNVIVRKDVNGAMEIKRKMPHAIVVFIDVESPQVLESRLRARQTDSEEQIQARLVLAEKEQEFKKHFDYVVVNVHNHPENAVSEVEQALGYS